MRKRRKKKSNLFLLLLLVISVSIGYALVSTTLNITGIAGINKNTWDIHWDSESVVVSNGSVSATKPIVSGTNDDTVTFSADLELPGDFFEFTVDAVNEGTVDGEITIKSKGIYNVNDEELTGDNLPSYINYTVTYADNGLEPSIGDILEKRIDENTPTARTYKVRVEIDPDTEVLPSSDTTYKFKYTVTYEQHKESTPTGPYTVNFNPNGGTVDTTSKEVEANEKIGELPVAEKENQGFRGWYTEIDGGERLGNKYIVNKNQTVYAHWNDIQAKFDIGKNVNAKFKGLAGDDVSGDYPWGVYDTNITAVKRASSAPETGTITEIVSAPDSPSEIYAWFDNGTIYWWSEAGSEFLNEDASNMFNNMSALVEFEPTFDTSLTTNMSYMLSYCGFETVNVSTFNTSNVTNMSYMFYGNSNLVSLDLSHFDTRKVSNMNSLVGYNNKLETLNLGGFNFSSYNPDQLMTQLCGYGDIKIKTLIMDEAVFNTNMYGTFYDLKNLENISLKNVDTSRATTMYKLFYNCSKLKSVDLSDFDTENVTNMSQMFYYCQALEDIDFGHINTGTVHEMNQMFYYCSSLTSLDLSMFDTSETYQMNYMFTSCSNLEYLNLSNWDFRNNHASNLMDTLLGSNQGIKTLILDNTKYGVSMDSAFYSMDNVEEISLKNVDTSHVVNMRQLFGYNSKLKELDLGSFDTSNVTNMSYMFAGCSSLTTISVSDNFVVDQVTTDENMFDDNYVLEGGQGTPYTSAHKLKDYAHYDHGDSDPGYFDRREGTTYTVTLDANGGAVSPASISVRKGRKVGELPTPTWKNHIFLGWQLVTPEVTPVDSNYRVNSNVTFVATWREAEIYTITFDANGGVIDPSDVTRQVVEGEEIGTLPVVTRENWYLDYWYVGITDRTVVNATYKPTGNITVYAYWRVDVDKMPYEDQQEVLENDTACIDFKLGDTRGTGANKVRVANCSKPLGCSLEKYSQTACGLVYEYVDVVSFTSINSSDTIVGGYKDSNIRSVIQSLAPAEAIPVKVVSGYDRYNTQNIITYDKAYLLSGVEVFGGNAGYNTGEQYPHDTTEMYTRQLDIYATPAYRDGGKIAAKRYYGTFPPDLNPGHFPDHIVPWALRNVDYYNSNVNGIGKGTFGSVTAGSIPEYRDWSATTSIGVSPAFRIG